MFGKIFIGILSRIFSFIELLIVTIITVCLIWNSGITGHTLELTISVMGYFIYFALWRMR